MRVFRRCTPLTHSSWGDNGISLYTAVAGTQVDNNGDVGRQCSSLGFASFYNLLSCAGSMRCRYEFWITSAEAYPSAVEAGWEEGFYWIALKFKVGRCYWEFNCCWSMAFGSLYADVWWLRIKVKSLSMNCQFDFTDGIINPQNIASVSWAEVHGSNPRSVTFLLLCSCIGILHTSISLSMLIAITTTRSIFLAFPSLTCILTCRTPLMPKIEYCHH